MSDKKPKYSTLDNLIKEMQYKGASSTAVNEMIVLMKEIGMLANDVKADYKDNPSELSGSVNTDKGLVKGDGVQIHQDAIPDTEEEWELMPTKKPRKKKKK